MNVPLAHEVGHMPSRQRAVDRSDLRRIISMLHECDGIAVDRAPWTYPNHEPYEGVVDALLETPPHKSIKQSFECEPVVKVHTIPIADIPVAEPEAEKPAAEAAKPAGARPEIVVEDGAEDLEDDDGYVIHASMDDGNCLFDSVRQAVASIGSKAQIEDLRTAVAKTILDPADERANAALDGWRQIYSMAKVEGDKELLADYGHAAVLEGVEGAIPMDTRRELYAKMMTRDYWGEEYAVLVLERLLNIKFLVIDAESQKAKAGEDHGPNFRPSLYAIFVLERQHYQPVSKNGKFMFKPHEIPKDIVRKFQTDLKSHARPYMNLRFPRKAARPKRPAKPLR